MADLEHTTYKATINYSREPAQLRCACGSCDWIGNASELKSIQDCSLTPGQPSPAGRCPKCDVLAYVKPHPDDDTVARARWDAICRQQAWNERSQVIHLLTFIQEQGLLEKLAEFSHSAADSENAQPR